MRSLAFFLCAALMLLASPAFAADDCIVRNVPHAVVSGSGKGTRLVFHVYDATLYAPDGVYNAKKPFALKLTYRMNFKGADIADESVRQMRHLGMNDDPTLAQWHEDMEKIFPDVKPGDSLTGIHLANDQTLFCHGGREIGHVNDKAFGHYFFGIWLDDKSEDPALRDNLLKKS